MKHKYELIRASRFEVGLTCDGHGVRTWWRSAFKGLRPTLSHPRVREAIKINETMLKEKGHHDHRCESIH